MIGNMEGLDEEQRITDLLYMLVRALSTLELSLPSVNWWPIFSKLVGWPCPRVRRMVLYFSARHALQSASLAEVLQALLLGFPSEDDTHVRQLLVGELGVGRLLEMGGLTATLDANMAKRLRAERKRGMDEGMRSSVSATQARDILRCISEQLFMDVTKRPAYELKVSYLLQQRTRR
jgi:hypothetical protein